MSDNAPRPKKPQAQLTVVDTTRLTDHMVRVTLGGPGFTSFDPNEYSDMYAKLLFVKPELGLTAPYDLAALRETLTPEDLPVTRTYTIRAVREDSLDIDFVVHGDEGLAGPWAAQAKVGDTLTLLGPGGAYSPNPAADWYLFAGDEAALPAIAASVERLGADARGYVFVEVFSADDEQELAAPAGVQVNWLHRGDAPAGSTTLLADAVAAAEWLDGAVDVFAHGEREAMKALRDVFFKQHSVPRGQVSLSGYWAYGRTEDRFQAEKREPIGQIL